MTGFLSSNTLFGFQLHRVSPNRILKPFYLLFAQALVLKRQALRYSLISRSLNAYTSSVGQLLKTLCQHHTFSRYSVVRNYYLTHADTDPKSWLNVVLERGNEQ